MSTLTINAKCLGTGGSARVHAGTLSTPVPRGDGSPSAEAFPVVPRERAESADSGKSAVMEVPVSRAASGDSVMELPRVSNSRVSNSDSDSDNGEHVAVAVKIVCDDHDILGRELDALLRVGRHDNIAALQCDELVLASSMMPDAQSDVGSGISAEDESPVTGGDMCLLTELCDADLISLLEARASAGKFGLPFEELGPMFSQLCAAVAHCHQQGVYHCDIKPDNVLLKDGIVKLSDFGAATTVRCLPAARVERSNLGSLPYLAPELVAGQTRSFVASGEYRSPHLTHPKRASALDATLYDDDCFCGGYKGGHVDFAAADVWALGVLLFNLYTGEQPWGRAHVQDLSFSRYVNGGLGWDYLPVPLRKLVRATLEVDPCARPTAAQLAEIVWLQEGKLPGGDKVETSTVLLDESMLRAGVPASMASRIAVLPDPTGVSAGPGTPQSSRTMELPPSIAARVTVLPDPPSGYGYHPTPGFGEGFAGDSKTSLISETPSAKLGVGFVGGYVGPPSPSPPPPDVETASPSLPAPVTPVQFTRRRSYSAIITVNVDVSDHEDSSDSSVDGEGEDTVHPIGGTRSEPNVLIRGHSSSALLSSASSMASLHSVPESEAALSPMSGGLPAARRLDRTASWAGPRMRVSPASAEKTGTPSVHVGRLTRGLLSFSEKSRWHAKITGSLDRSSSFGRFPRASTRERSHTTGDARRPPIAPATSPPAPSS